MKMKKSFFLLLIVFLLIFLSGCGRPQDPKAGMQTYHGDGFALDYPEGWTASLIYPNR